MQHLDWRKYLFALIITAVIFGTALYISDSLSEKRLAELRAIENRISTDILSLETQFDLLEELSCRNITESSALSQELNTLERRLSYTETDLGTGNEEVQKLKEAYSLLQIKDYLLMKKISEKCGLTPVFILYFYSNEGDCRDCTKEGHVLSLMREQYPTLRVYSFDYHLGLSALDTLITINDVEDTLPALVIDDQVYYGFHDQEAIESILPELAELRNAAEAATTTKEEF
jgi:hypothetical protein